VNLDGCLQISISLYEQFIQKVSLFKGCSSGFIKQIVRKSRISDWKVGVRFNG